MIRPSSPDEVAAGEATMRAHELAIGDHIAVTGANGTKNLEVVGSS